jgi:hypothetical protein
MDDDITRTRRKGTVLVGLAALGVAVVAGAAFLWSTMESSDQRPAPDAPTDQTPSSAAEEPHSIGPGTPATLKSGSYQWGVYLGVQVEFDAKQGLDDGAFIVGDERFPVQFWTEATDCDCDYPDPLPVHPGEMVLIEATSAIPDCSLEPADTVLLAVQGVLPNGDRIIHRFAGSNPQVYADAFADWCSKSVSLMIGNSSVTVDGDAAVTIHVINPGPGVVVVETPAIDLDGVTWDATRTTVPAGDSVDIRVTGTGVTCGMQTVSWMGGQLTVDGVPTDFPDGDQWC